MARTERQIWRRHRKGCRHYGKPNPRALKGCECPVYARVTILDPQTDATLFSYDASLFKIGIRNLDAAERLVDKWFQEYLSGNRQPQADEDRLNRTVRQAVDAYLERLAIRIKPKLKEWHGNEPTKHLTYRKYRVLLDKLAAWCDENELERIRQLETEHVVLFQESWTGRAGQPKSDISKDREQGLLRRFFAWCRSNKWIVEDPCEHVERITPGSSEPKPFTRTEQERIFSLIPEHFPKTAEQVTAFVSMLKYTGARISAVATAEIARLEADGIWLRERKTEGNRPANYVWCLLPPELVAMLEKLEPRSKDYWFWSGSGTLKTIVTDWGDKLKDLYIAAGIEVGRRSHEWRDTLGLELQDAGADLEHIQAALSHAQKATTERHYVGKNKRKFSEVDVFKRKLWGMNGGNASGPPQSPGMATSELDPVGQLQEAERMLTAGTINRKEFQELKKRILTN